MHKNRAALWHGSLRQEDTEANTGGWAGDIVTLVLGEGMGVGPLGCGTEVPVWNVPRPGVEEKHSILDYGGNSTTGGFKEL